MIKILLRPYLLLLFVLALSGCATEMKNTVIGTREELPVKVSRLLVVYEPSQFVISKGPSPQAQQARVTSILAMFQDALERITTAEIAKARIPMSFAVGTGPQATSPNSVQYSHIIYITPLRDQQVCYGSSCSHRLGIQIRLLRANSKLMMWSTEVEEPYMNSSFAYQARYDDFAENVTKAILLAVKSSDG